MKKTVFIILFVLFSLTNADAQNNVVAIMAIPQNSAISLLKPSKPASINQKLINAVHLHDKENAPILLFNDYQVLQFKKAGKMPVRFFTEISCSDMLEGSVNMFNPALINTYDDHITELFKEAPSLVKVKCVITL